MENFEIYIKSNDISNYMLEHKENLKYKEALFIKYLEDNAKDDYEKKQKIGLHINYPCDNFDTYLRKLRNKDNLDISDISLILVPALGLNNLYTGDVNNDDNYINNYARLLDDNADMEKVLMEAIYHLKNISNEYSNSLNDIDSSIKQLATFNETLRKYIKLRKIGIIESNNNDFSLIGKDRCNKELDIYTTIYGFYTVNIIKNYTKELKRNYL